MRHWTFLHQVAASAYARHALLDHEVDANVLVALDWLAILGGGEEAPVVQRGKQQLVQTRLLRRLQEFDLDGWLLYDFRGSNPIARSVIGFDESQIGTRRWFYLIPRAGQPVGILHAIEPNALRGAPGTATSDTSL